MPSIKLIPAVLLAAGMALSAPPADDPAKPVSPRATDSKEFAPGLRAVPPVLRNTEQQDSQFVVLPGPPINPSAAIAPLAPPVPIGPDPERPRLHRAEPSYPEEFGAESGLYCQSQIGSWTLEDATDMLGDPKRHRLSMDDDGAANGDIFAFFDPSSRYRELELDFDRETGTLRTVFAYPWKMTWQECRKLWGARVTSAEVDKGRVFYSYLDRRLDVLVDPTGRVISFGLY